MIGKGTERRPPKMERYKEEKKKRIHTYRATKKRNTIRRKNKPKIEGRFKEMLEEKKKKATKYKKPFNSQLH